MADIDKRQQHVHDLIYRYQACTDQASKRQLANEIIEYLEPYCSTVASAYCRSTDEHDDLLQIARIHCLDLINRFDGRAPFLGYFRSTYPRAVCSFQMSSFSRARKLDGMRHSLSIELVNENGEQFQRDDIAEHSPSTFDIVADEDSKQIGLSALRKRLSKRELRILEMYLTGMSYASMSSESGYSIKTIDNALSRVKSKAKMLLRQGIIQPPVE